MDKGHDEQEGDVMKRCESCKRELDIGERCYDFIMEVGGPNGGCREWACDEIEARIYARDATMRRSVTKLTAWWRDE